MTGSAERDSTRSTSNLAAPGKADAASAASSASDNRFLVLGKSAEGRRAAVDALRVLRADV
ncbi:MAG: hypothetical protein AAF909_10865, partial [Pseudomonadota bacterium]